MIYDYEDIFRPDITQMYVYVWYILHENKSKHLSVG